MPSSRSLSHTHEHKAPGDCVAGPVEEFEKNIEDAKSAYDDLVQKIDEAIGNEGRKLPSDARSSATNAYDCAKELYNWVSRLLDVSESSWASPKREEKLVSMPYIVALAYAVRIMIDARMVMSHESEDESSRELMSLECRRIMDSFRSLAGLAVIALTLNVGFLEAAWDCRLPLEAYMMLTVGMNANDPILTKRKSIAVVREQEWGMEYLSDIR